MARKTIRIKLPRKSPSNLLLLLSDIKKKHDDLGANSPLDATDAAAIDALITSLQPKYTEAKELEAGAQILNEQVRVGLGMYIGQTAQTPGTGMYLTTKLRDLLLSLHKGNEESLSLYGFNVVVGQARIPRRRKEKPA